MKIHPHHLERFLATVMLLAAVGFNLYLYRLEPTAKIDPNDNAFQYALVDRTNVIWDYAVRTCSGNPLTFPFCHFSYLADHWVHNWAEGYNLPYYYSHIPQILIVASYRLVSFFIGFWNSGVSISLFQWYHAVIYLLLCLFPVPVFLALRLLGLPWLIAGFGAIITSHISTDGLYGLDPPSFLWRGWGLSSQLFAMIWLPLALAYSFRYLTGVHHDIRLRPFRIAGLRELIPAIFFTSATVAGHLGIGIIALMSIGVLAISTPFVLFLEQMPLRTVLSALRKQVFRIAVLAGCTVFVLSYWIVPVLVDTNYHNISWWDPVWKFNSYGWTEIVKHFFNGDLFDFGRLPILTFLVGGGAVAAALGNFRIVQPVTAAQKRHDMEEHVQHNYPYAGFALLFVFWMAMYFGRTTWKGLIDLIPGMKDYHLHRFIVGVHLAGLFLVPIGVNGMLQILESGYGILRHRIRSVILLPELRSGFPQLTFSVLFLVVFSTLVLPPVFRQTVYYNELNDRLIVQANSNYEAVEANFLELYGYLKTLPPGRVFAGRGGGWGKDFTIAETTYFMQLSTFGIPTVTWLPETWSLNSDTEQYFSEDLERTYRLYNIRYIVAPPGQTPQPFWTLRRENPKWKVYEVDTTGYIDVGTVPIVVKVGKENFINVVRNWIQSDLHEKGSFPELIFSGWTKTPYNSRYTLQHFPMVDEVTYTDVDGKRFNIFNTPLPLNIDTPTGRNVGPETVVDEMEYSSTVMVDEGCVNCMVVLRQTAHPNWRVSVDGATVPHTDVFPFFVAAPVTPGTHRVTFTYQPGRLKMLLLSIELVALAALPVGFFITRRKRRNPHRIGR